MFSQHEYCLLCSSLNKLLVGDTDHAWECWNCNVRYWIDDQARLEYMVHYGIPIEIAEKALEKRNGTPTVKVHAKSVKTGELFTLDTKQVPVNFCMIESND